MDHAVSDSHQHVVQRLAGHGFDKRAHQPSQTQGDGAAQADGFALHKDSGIGLLESPVGIQTPQEPAVVGGALFLFGRGARAGHFRNAAGDALTRNL